MSDVQSVGQVVITDPYRVPVTFVNYLLSSGHVNGVINLTLGTMQFTPRSVSEDIVDPDLVVSSRLRMDLYCAKAIRDALDKTIKQIEQAMMQPANGTSH